jgi:hypothetical protein
MPVKLFILGLPGSGKSGAARNIASLVEDHGKIPQHLRDYDIPYKMYTEDKKGISFASTEDQGYDGFNVTDSYVLDDALEELNRWVVQEDGVKNGEVDLIIIEFSRVDYCKALSFFITHLTHDTYILFIDAEIPVCKQRIRNRVEHPKTPDDHYVSEYIFTAYYEQDHRDYANQVAAQLKEQFSIGDENIQVIYNGSTVSEQQFYDNVRAFTENIVLQSL